MYLNFINVALMPRFVDQKEHPQQNSDMATSSTANTPPRQAHTPTNRSIQSLLCPQSTPTRKRTTRNPEPPDQLLDTRNGQMPASFASLLSLHGALENAVLLHLSTQGANATLTYNSSQPPPPSSSLPHDNTSNSPSRSVDRRMKTPEPEECKPLSDNPDPPCAVKTFRFENLISWPVVQPIVERAAGRKFSVHQLAQLLWLWQNYPEDFETKHGLPNNTSGETLDMDQSSKSSTKEQVGMGFIISSVRALEGSVGNPNKKRVAYTYGLGLEIKARENRQLPTYSLESPGKSNQFLDSSPNRSNQVGRSPSNSSKRVVKTREVMSLVALWSSKSVERKNEVARRLRSYWLIHSNLSKDQSGIDHRKFTSSNHKKIKSEASIKIPAANLPTLETKNDNNNNDNIRYLNEEITSPSRKLNNIQSSSNKRKLAKKDVSPTLSSSFSFDDDDDLEFDQCSMKRLKSHLTSPLPNRIIIPSVKHHVSPLLVKSSQSNSSVQLRALNLLERIKAKEEKLTSPSRKS